MERQITHRCGHVQRHQIAGFYAADRDRAAARLSCRRCDNCHGAGGASLDDGPCPGVEPLPRLAGSPRQVAWAEDIRRQQLAVLRRLDPGAVEEVAAVKDARWWIEHRRDDPSTIMTWVGARQASRRVTCRSIDM